MKSQAERSPARLRDVVTRPAAAAVARCQSLALLNAQCSLFLTS